MRSEDCSDFLILDYLDVENDYGLPGHYSVHVFERIWNCEMRILQFLHLGKESRKKLKQIYDILDPLL